MPARPDIVISLMAASLAVNTGATVHAHLPGLALSSEYRPNSEQLELENQLKNASLVEFPSHQLVSKVRQANGATPNLSAKLVPEDTVLVNPNVSGTSTVSIGFSRQQGNYFVVKTEGSLIKKGSTLNITAVVDGSSVAVSEGSSTVVFTGNQFGETYPGVLTYSFNGGANLEPPVYLGSENPLGQAALTPKGDRATLLSLRYIKQDGHKAWRYDLAQRGNREVSILGYPTTDAPRYLSSIQQQPDGRLTNFSLGIYGYAEMTHLDDQIQAQYFPILTGFDHLIEELPGPDKKPSALVRNQYVATPTQENAALASKFTRFGTLIQYQQGQVVDYHQPNARLYPYNPAGKNILEIVAHKVDSAQQAGLMITQLKDALGGGTSTQLEFLDLAHHRNFLLSLDGAPQDLRSLLIVERDGKKHLQVSNGRQIYEAPISSNLKTIGQFKPLSSVRFETVLPLSVK